MPGIVFSPEILLTPMKTTFQHTILAALLSSLPAFAVEVGSFDELKQNIGQDNIVLTADITFTSSGTSIKHDITFDGQNQFQMYGNGKIGFDPSDGVNITFQNFSAGYGVYGFENSWDTGAVIEGLDCNLTITNSIFSHNHAGDDGSLIWMIKGSIDINESIFHHNTSDAYGGVISTALEMDDIVIRNSVFMKNHAELGGAALYLSIAKNRLFIEDSKFSKNRSDDNDYLNWDRPEGSTSFAEGGTVFLTDQMAQPNGKYMPAYIYGCTFESNETEAAGAAITLDFNSHIVEEVYIVDSTFTDNKATLKGAAIFACETRLYIYAHERDVIFSGNQTMDNSVEDGSDIYLTINIPGSYNVGPDEVHLYLVAHPNYSITFEGSVAGVSELSDGTSTIPLGNSACFVHVNTEEGEYYRYGDDKAKTVTPGGAVSFLGGLANVSVDITSTYIKLGQVGANDEAIRYETVIMEFSGENNVLDVNNSVAEDIMTEKFTINQGAELEYKLDVDLANTKADCLHNATNNGTLTIGNVITLSDTTASEVKIMYSTNNVEGVFADGQESWLVSTSNHSYTVNLLNEDGEGSFLVFKQKEQSVNTGDRKKGLAGAVYEVHDVWNNTDPDIHWVTWYPDDKTGTMEPKNYLEKDLIINSHNKAIRSEVADQEGMIVGEEFRATVNNARDWSGFRNGIINRGKLYINDSNFTGNTGEGGVLNEGGEVHLAGDVTFDNPDADYDLLSKGGSVSMHGGHARFNQGVHGENGATFDIAGDVDFNGTLSGFDRVTQTSGTVSAGRVKDTNYEIEGGRLNVRREEDFTPDGFAFGGGTVNAQNGRVGDIHFTHASGTPGSVTNVEVDIDLSGLTMDRLLPEGATWPGGTINVSKFNVLTDTTAKTAYVNFTNSYLKHYVTTDVKTVYGPIYNYNIGYDEERGDFFFTARGGKNWGDYNPAVIPSSVAALMGGYLAQLNSYDDAFRNMDMYMLQGGGTSGRVYKVDGNDKNGVVPRSPFAHANYWVRPFSSFENVPLRNGPNVSNVSYGSLIGNESRMYNLGSGWSGIIGGYMGYYGSHQIYGGASIYQDGGMVGMVSMAYKGNLFTGITMNVGASDGNAKTMYGRDDFSMLTAGVASKTGYNYALSGGKYVIQPVAMVSYSMVNPFSYNNAAGLHMNADAIHAVHAEPGVKFIADLGNELQFYTSASFVFNFFDKTDFKANRVKLPEMSIKHYVKYGMGLRQTWDNGLIGYIQAYMTNGGRNSVSIQCGLRWDFGGSLK